SRTTPRSRRWPTAWCTSATGASSASRRTRTSASRRSCPGEQGCSMKALDRKLLRDLRLMWSQALTIALVVASGIGGFVTSLSAVDSLALARDRFYADGRFADVFASVKRAPNSLVDAVRDVPGVADVQTS